MNVKLISFITYIDIISINYLTSMSSSWAKLETRKQLYVVVLLTAEQRR